MRRTAFSMVTYNADPSRTRKLRGDNIVHRIKAGGRAAAPSLVPDDVLPARTAAVFQEE